MPPGFLALDLGAALGLPVYDPDARSAPVEAGRHPLRGNALIGESAGQPEVVVAANGGSDLIYLPKGDRGLAARVGGVRVVDDAVLGRSRVYVGTSVPVADAICATGPSSPRPSDDRLVQATGRLE